MRETIDFAKLRNDILDNDHNDLFSKQILSQFTSKIKIFIEKYEDLSENAVWVKKPKIEVKQSNKPKCKGNTKSIVPKRSSNKVAKPANIIKQKLENSSASKPNSIAKTFVSKEESDMKNKQKYCKEIKLEESQKKLEKPNKSIKPKHEEANPESKGSDRKRSFMRPNTTLSNYSTIDPQTCKNHPRDLSESFVFGASRNGLKLDNDSQRRLSICKEESLCGGLNTTMAAMDILRGKQNRFNSMRRSCDQNILRSFQNDSIADLNELRNKNKINRQKRNYIDQNGLSIDTIHESSKKITKKCSINEAIPFNVIDENVENSFDEKNQYLNPKKLINKGISADKYETLGLASKLIFNMLECIESDESLQLAVLDECKLLIESKMKIKKRNNKSKPNGLKLRQAVKKFANKENNSIEYEVALSNIQDLFKHLTVNQN